MTSSRVTHSRNGRQRVIARSEVDVGNLRSWEIASSARNDRSTDTTWIQAKAKKVRNTAVPQQGTIIVSSPGEVFSLTEDL